MLLERLGDCHFIIKQPYVIRDDAHDFQFRTGTPGQCESLLSLLSGWSNMSPPPAIEFFPTISPFNYYSIEGVRKASALSSQAEFQQVQVDLSTDSRSGDEVDEQVDTRWDMVSGTVNDILEWTVLQCNQGPDNDSIFVYSTLLFFHLSTHYSFSDSFSSHWKSRKLPSSAKAMGVALNINWDQMLRTLGEQVARSYVLLTQKERERFVKICKKHLSKSSCTVMKKSLENYQQVEFLFSSFFCPLSVLTVESYRKSKRPLYFPSTRTCLFTLCGILMRVLSRKRRQFVCLPPSCN